jgi:hypothetical protein
MSRTKQKRKTSLAEKYPPSQPCSCTICLRYCVRPGWWTVAEAAQAIQEGYAKRMMLEVAPELTFGVLSPAFKGCERNYALNDFAKQGCTFLKEERCELFGTGCQPLECRFCHHERPGMGPLCHADLEKDWHTPAGQSLVLRWCELTGFAKNHDIYGLKWLEGLPVINSSANPR